MTVEEMIKTHRDEAIKRIEKERSEKIFELVRWETGLKLFCNLLEEDKHITNIRYSYSYYNEPSIEYYDTDAPAFDIRISVFNDRFYVRLMRRGDVYVIHSSITVPMEFNGNFDIPTVYEFIKTFSSMKSKKVNDVDDNINSKQTKEA